MSENLPFMSPRPNSGQRPSSHDLWVLLGLLAIELAWATLVRYGNMFGNDEWAVLFGVARGGIRYAGNRPLDMLPQFLSYHILGPQFTSGHFLFLTLRLATGFVLYRLINQYSTDHPLFAVSCAALYLVHLVDDWLLILTYAMLTYTAATLLDALALLMLSLYLRRSHSGWLMSGIVLAFISLMLSEVSLPLLIVIPIFMLLADRKLVRSSAIGIAVWTIVMVGGVLRYILPVFRLAEATYSSGLYTGINPSHVVSSTLVQMDIAFRQYVLASPLVVVNSLWPVLLIMSTVLVVLILLRSIFPPAKDTSDSSSWQIFALWLAIGLSATWLGFALFLATPLVAYGERIHPLALIGEAVTLASIAWLFGSLISLPRFRVIAQFALVALFASIGAARALDLQEQLSQVCATWETQAIYLRSLSHLAPAVEDHTLFIYIEDPDLTEVPFLSGWAFTYSVRYLYEERAAGIVDRDNHLFHEIDVSDAGVKISPNDVLARAEYVGTINEFYQWDEVIFVSKDAAGKAIILTKVPPEFYTISRSTQYRPAARIHHAFVPNRVQEILPPIDLNDRHCQW